MPSPIRSEFPTDRGPLADELTRWFLNSSRRSTGALVHAEGFLLDDAFLVLRGSQALVEEADGFARKEDKPYRDLRDRLVSERHLVRDGDVYVFIRDYLFNSPSAATTVILARAASGPEEWRDQRGVKLADSLED